MIHIQDLSKTYHSKRTSFKALKSIDLEIHSGEIFGIIGRSGAGKSSLVRCINLLEMPSSGRILFDGLDITQLSQKDLRAARQQIGMIFQHFNLFSARTVFENIAFPLEVQGFSKVQIKEKVEKLIALTHLEDKRDLYPDALSGGQKQRVAIARALASDPKVLLSDESTSALDPETTDAILSLLKEINRKLNITIILITHEMDVIKRICDRVAILDKGSVAEVGDVITVFTQPKTDTAIKLTQSVMNVDLPHYLAEKLNATGVSGDTPIVKLVFVGESTGTPLIADLIDQFQVVTNILQANIEVVQKAPLGVTICQMKGNKENLEKSMAYLKEKGVIVEVIGYVNANAFAAL